MKRNLLSLLLAGLMLTSCNTEGKKDYFTVTYHYNYGQEDQIYVTQVIYPEQKLTTPEEPNREDYVFSGWFNDVEGTSKFEGFDNYVNEDIHLYATWRDYESLTDIEKIEKFIKKIESLNGNVTSSYVQQTGTIIYYFIPYQFDFGINRSYTRYKDITVVDYYGVNEDTPYAQEQYLYDDKNFYVCFKDLEDDSNSFKETAKFSEREINTFLDINFTNINFGLLKELSTHLKNGVEEDEVYYEFDFNYTKVDTNELTYSFSFFYQHNVYSENMGTWYSDIYNLNCGLSFENGKIKGSKVISSYLMALGDELYQGEEFTTETRYYINSEYPEFTGTRFNPNDFKEDTSQ